MAYKKLPYNNPFTAEFNPSHATPSRGVEIRRDVPILESKAVNERRRAERDAAGLTNNFKLKKAHVSEDALQDQTYYDRMLDAVLPSWQDKTNLGWDEL